MVEEKSIYGLIGKKLGHSYSQKLFTEKFRKENIDAVYEMLEFPTDESVREFLNANRGDLNIKGLNVTVPYKQSVIPCLDSLSEDVRKIGAVNVIKFNADGTLEGHNSDWAGFTRALKPYLRKDIRKALVLGTGGASKAVCHALRKLEIYPQPVSRIRKNDILSYEDIDACVISDYKLIVNTTPLGMWPEIENCPAIPYSRLTSEHVCFDLVYNPEETSFMRKSRKYGATVCNGLEMLVGQAEEAWKIWHGLSTPDD